MAVRKIFFVLFILLAFVSCESVINDNKKNQLDNEVDQKQVDNIYNHINLNNYGQSITDLSTLYGKRMKEIGIKGNNTAYILNRTFAVWPQNYPKRQERMQMKLNTEMSQYDSKTRKLNGVRSQKNSSQTQKKQKKVSAFDVFLHSKKADTTLTKVEGKYLGQVQQAYSQHHKKAVYYISKLQDLKNKYEENYDLTKKERVYIVGISNSVSAYLKQLSKMQEQLSARTDHKKINKAGIIPVAFLLQQGGDNRCDSKKARKHFTAPDCSFEADYGDLALSGTLGGAMGGAGSSFGVALTGMAGGPLGIMGSAIAIGFGTMWGAGSGTLTEFALQKKAHKQYIKENINNDTNKGKDDSDSK